MVLGGHVVEDIPYHCVESDEDPLLVMIVFVVIFGSLFPYSLKAFTCLEHLCMSYAYCVCSVYLERIILSTVLCLYINTAQFLPNASDRSRT